MSRIRFYVPCMTRSPERVAKAAAISHRLSPNVLVMEAVDGATLDVATCVSNGTIAPPNDDDGALHDMYDRPLSAAQLGCALSHVNAVRAIADVQEEDYAVVFEDDVELDPAFESKIRDMISCMDANSWIDVVNLYVWPQDRVKLDAASRAVGEIVRVPIVGHFGAQCIMYRKSSAKKVLRRVLPLRNPWDDQLACAGLRYVTVLNVDFVAHGDHASTVGTGGSKVESNVGSMMESSVGSKMESSVGKDKESGRLL